MKLQHDKGLIEALVEANDIKSRHPKFKITDGNGGEVDMTDMGLFSGILHAEKASSIILYHIDNWMEQHGLTVVSIRKAKMVNKWQIGDLVVIMDETHENYREIGEVIATAPFAVKVKLEGGMVIIVPNEFLEFYRIQKGDGHETE